MPKARWLTFEGRTMRLTAWAIEYDLKPQTLAHRLERGLPMSRALATGLASLEEAGRRGAARSPWRCPALSTGG